MRRWWSRSATAREAMLAIRSMTGAAPAVLDAIGARVDAIADAAGEPSDVVARVFRDKVLEEDLAAAVLVAYLDGMLAGLRLGAAVQERAVAAMVAAGAPDGVVAGG